MKSWWNKCTEIKSICCLGHLTSHMWCFTLVWCNQCIIKNKGSSTHCMIFTMKLESSCRKHGFKREVTWIWVHKSCWSEPESLDSIIFMLIEVYTRKWHGNETACHLPKAKEAPLCFTCPFCFLALISSCPWHFSFCLLHYSQMKGTTKSTTCSVNYGNSVKQSCCDNECNQASRGTSTITEISVSPCAA